MITLNPAQEAELRSDIEARLLDVAVKRTALEALSEVAKARSEGTSIVHVRIEGEHMTFRLVP